LPEERRCVTRYRLAAPVYMSDRIVGQTVNMSTCGILFESDGSYELGQKIHLLVGLKESTVECEGRVVRVEELPIRFGIAVAIEACSFC
jgi:hypothetical protein